ncbi:MAG: hypothetical protein JF587_15355 [Catenulisporales bacterium]|nr:hypothetical protein [Catenulisporales bacterium]
MTRRLRALATGLTAAGVMACALLGAGIASAAAADDGTGPVATPPAVPATQSVSGVAANGVQLLITAPKQLPLDLPGRQLPGRELDVTVKDVARQGFTGSVDITLTAEGAGVTRLGLRIERYDQDSGSWKPVPVPPGAGASSTVSTPLTVLAGGLEDVRLRLSPGTTAVDDVKVAAAANGATAVATVPVTEPRFAAGGLTATVRAGTAEVITGRLTNPTDVDYRHVPVRLYLKACSPSLGTCFGAADVKLEVSVGGVWRTVAAADDPAAAGGVAGTVFPDVTLKHGDAVELTARVTLNSGTATVNPVPIGFGPIGLSFAGQQTTGGTLTVQPVMPPSPTPTSSPSGSTSSSPSATPSDSASSATDTPTVTGSSTTPTATPSTAPTLAAALASTPSSGGSSNSATILVALGLLAVCLALVLWWALMKRREQHQRAAAMGEDE